MSTWDLDLDNAIPVERLLDSDFHETRTSSQDVLDKWAYVRKRDQDAVEQAREDGGGERAHSAHSAQNNAISARNEEEEFVFKPLDGSKGFTQEEEATAYGMYDHDIDSQVILRLWCVLCGVCVLKGGCWVFGMCPRLICLRDMTPICDTAGLFPLSSKICIFFLRRWRCYINNMHTDTDIHACTHTPTHTHTHTHTHRRRQRHTHTKIHTYTHSL